LIMKFYEIGSLSSFLPQYAVSSYIKWSIIRDICIGVGALHQYGIVHNDLKPANILLEPHPLKQVHAVVTDFGIATIVEPVALTVNAFVVANIAGATLRYAAPEAIVRFRQNFTPSAVRPQIAKAADVYSISMIIYEVMNLRCPHA